MTDISVKSTGSQRSATPANSTAIDPQQVLSLCAKIKETMNRVDKSLKLTQLRLKALHYVDDASSQRCSNDLVELDGLSQQLVQQIDELRAKLADLTQDQISFQVASQQLAYFTSEWSDRLMPKFDATFSLADQQLELGLNYGRAGSKRPVSAMSPAELRVRDALLRLKKSMEENERLIGSIANSLEITKTSIQAIFQSLQTTKVNVDASQANTREAIQLQRDSSLSSLLCYLICTMLLAILALLVLKIVGIV